MSSYYVPMNQIIPGLWLGNVQAAMDYESLKANNIGHIVTVLDYNRLQSAFYHDAPFPLDQFKQLYICADDDVHQDLLEHFDAAFKFITDGLATGKAVLVHCQVGVSRSATIVIGYLMHSQGVSLNDACKIVTSARPMVSPNPGFMSQLTLLELMGGRSVNHKHPRYRQYRLARFAMSQASSETNQPPPTENIPCTADPQQVPQGSTAAAAEGDADSTSAASVGGDDPVYRCRMCRRQLFSSSGLLAHPAYQPKGSVPGVAAPECSRELFVEPVEWMRADVGASISGKLACPKCSAKVGSFTWVGERCSCGHFVCPAFHLRAQAVDAPAAVPAAAVTLPPPTS